MVTSGKYKPQDMLKTYFNTALLHCHSCLFNTVLMALQRLGYKETSKWNMQGIRTEYAGT